MRCTYALARSDAAILVRIVKKNIENNSLAAFG